MHLDTVHFFDSLEKFSEEFFWVKKVFCQIKKLQQRETFDASSSLCHKFPISQKTNNCWKWFCPHNATVPRFIVLFFFSGEKNCPKISPFSIATERKNKKKWSILRVFDSFEIFAQLFWIRVKEIQLKGNCVSHGRYLIDF